MLFVLLFDISSQTLERFVWGVRIILPSNITYNSECGLLIHCHCWRFYFLRLRLLNFFVIWSILETFIIRARPHLPVFIHVTIYLFSFSYFIINWISKYEVILHTYAVFHCMFRMVLSPYAKMKDKKTVNFRMIYILCTSEGLYLIYL